MRKETQSPHRSDGRFARWFHAIFDLESSGDLLLYSALVGIVSAVGAWIFASALRWTSALTYPLMGVVAAGSGDGSENPIAGLTWWAVLLLPALGGLLCGWLVTTFAPEAEGHGTDAVVKAFHRLQGVIRGRALVVKIIASVLTICSGGSAGREGPIAQIGAGFGSVLATRLKLSSVYRRTLMLAGAAGGIAAIFQAPLGGALFVCEVLYGSAAVEFTVVVPAVIASLTAYSFYIWICRLTEHFPWGHPAAHELHVSSNLQFDVSAQELPFFLIFAVLCAVVGFIYVKVFYGSRDYFFRKLRMPAMLKPALGGLMLGALVLLVRVPGQTPDGMPHVMGGGYHWIQQALDGTLFGNVWWVIGLLCLMKIFATAFSISSGGSGGVFAPSLFIGGMLGAAYGQFGHHYFPHLVPNPEVFVLVGMGGFFAGVAKVPLTSVLMVC
ncbi:MAG: chloride channel protein, partial [Planctomycetales bacterium]|nr:chloride channel protein [Planctomycetales bacterium]